MFRPEDLDEFNKAVNQWGRETHQQAAAQMSALGIVHRENSENAVSSKAAFKVSTRKNAGMINRLSFRMTRGLVFTHKGVGRGTKISQVGSTTRKAKPFLNPVIERRMQQLEDIVADHQLSLVVNALTIR